MLYLIILGCLLVASACLWLGWFLRARKQPTPPESRLILLLFKHLFPTNKSFDGTFLLFGMISLCHIALLGLFILQVILIFKPQTGETATVLTIFSPEINHTLLTVTISALAGFGGYFFGKASEREAQQNTNSETKP